MRNLAPFHLLVKMVGSPYARCSLVFGLSSARGFLLEKVV